MVRVDTLPQTLPGLLAGAFFLFLESLYQFSGTHLIGVPDITTPAVSPFNAGIGGNFQIAAIIALPLLVPSLGVMLVEDRILRAEVLAAPGRQCAAPCLHAASRLAAIVAMEKTCYNCRLFPDSSVGRATDC
jgi:hypothetical protein